MSKERRGWHTLADDETPAEPRVGKMQMESGKALLARELLLDEHLCSLCGAVIQKNEDKNTSHHGEKFRQHIARHHFLPIVAEFSNTARELVMQPATRHAPEFIKLGMASTNL